MGKSLTVGGGQNPFEPARIGAATLFGPAMENFPDMAPAMVGAGAAIQVADADGLADRLGELLADPDRTSRMAAAAAAWAKAEAGVLDAVEEALSPLLDAVEKRHARP
jgi:3-deoxy-D-manno-octulosonic-acid transferase